MISLATNVSKSVVQSCAILSLATFSSCLQVPEEPHDGEQDIIIIDTYNGEQLVVSGFLQKKNSSEGFVGSLSISTEVLDLSTPFRAMAPFSAQAETDFLGYYQINLPKVPGSYSIAARDSSGADAGSFSVNIDENLQIDFRSGIITDSNASFDAFQPTYVDSNEYLPPPAVGPLADLSTIDTDYKREVLSLLHISVFETLNRQSTRVGVNSSREFSHILEGPDGGQAIVRVESLADSNAISHVKRHTISFIGYEQAGYIVNGSYFYIMGHSYIEVCSNENDPDCPEGGITRAGYEYDGSDWIRTGVGDLIVTRRAENTFLQTVTVTPELRSRSTHGSTYDRNPTLVLEYDFRMGSEGSEAGVYSFEVPLLSGLYQQAFKPVKRYLDKYCSAQTPQHQKDCTIDASDNSVMTTEANYYGIENYSIDSGRIRLFNLNTVDSNGVTQVTQILSFENFSSRGLVLNGQIEAQYDLTSGSTFISGSGERTSFIRVDGRYQSRVQHGTIVFNRNAGCEDCAQSLEMLHSYNVDDHRDTDQSTFIVLALGQ